MSFDKANGETNKMYAPRPDAAFMAWAINLKDVAFINQAAAGLTPAQFIALEDAANNFATAYSDVVTSKAATLGFVSTKDAVRAESEAVLRELCQMIANNPAVSNTLKGELGLNVTPSSAGPVAVPENLNAVPYSNGDVHLSWNRAGNTSTTAFSIQAQYGVSTTWVQLGATTRSKIVLTGFTPGDQVKFRVFATRGGVSSSPCAPYTIYPGSEAEPITLMEAA